MHPRRCRKEEVRRGRTFRRKVGGAMRRKVLRVRLGEFDEDCEQEGEHVSDYDIVKRISESTHSLREG